MLISDFVSFRNQLIGYERATLSQPTKLPLYK